MTLATPGTALVTIESRYFFVLSTWGSSMYKVDVE